ncbi:MAG: hypothetical protein WB985_12215 [Candidatus Acidiferrales bacterium]
MVPQRFKFVSEYSVARCVRCETISTGVRAGGKILAMRRETEVSVDLTDHADIYEFVRNTVNVFSTQVRAEMCGTISTDARETEKMLVRVRDEHKALAGEGN